MSKRGVPLHYWDANTFIHIIQGNEPDGANILHEHAKMVDQGKLHIVTSAFTLAEVVKPKRSSATPLSITDSKKVISVFAGQYISLYDLTQPIAERARELQWHVGIKPPDAVHLATAEIAKVSRFDTYDDPLITKVQAVSSAVFNHPFDIGHPELSQFKLSI